MSAFENYAQQTPDPGTVLYETEKIIEGVYFNPSFGEVNPALTANDYRELAALNSQLQSGAADPSTAPGNLPNYPYVEVFNIWRMADFTIANYPGGTTYRKKFDVGDLINPGQNAPGIGSGNNTSKYFALIDDLGSGGISATTAKDDFSQYDSYGNFSNPKDYPDGYGVANPRPFMTSHSINSSPWSTLSDLPAAYAVSIQSDEYPTGVQGKLQSGPNNAQYWGDYVKSQAFPSGHSTSGTVKGVGTAMVAPRFYKDFVMAAAEFGRSRNIFGVHYPLDVIGGRMIGLYDIGYYVNQNGASDSGTDAKGFGLLPTTFSQANAELAQHLFGSEAAALNESPYADVCSTNGLAACIASGAIPTAQTFRDLRQQYVNLATYSDIPNGDGGYGFTPNANPTAEIPENTVAAVAPLLATRFPYLNAQHLRDVIATTALPGGGPLDNGSGWDMVNLYAAADGFGAFRTDTSIVMDASKGGYNAFDVWANDITGSGGFTLNGTGTLVFAGDSTYSGGTTVSGGTLGISGSIVGAVAVASGATLYNAGTITALTGTTVSNAGTLTNDGTIASDVVNSGLLSGNGTIDGVLTNAGTIAPGNSIGTIMVNGSVTFQPGSTYQVEMAPGGSSDLLTASGAITIQGGTLQLVAEPGLAYGFDTMTFLIADGGIGGTFDTVSDPFAEEYPFLDATVVYSGGTVRIETVRSNVDFETYATTPNQAAVAGALDSLSPDAPIVEEVAALNASTTPDALDQLSGEVYASTAITMVEDSRFVRDAARARIRGAFERIADPSMNVLAYGETGATGETSADAPAFAAWGQGYGSWGNWDGSGGVASVDRSIGGFAVGLDRAVGSAARLGVLAGYAQSSVDVDARHSSADVETTSLGAYAAAQLGGLSLSGGGAYAWHSTDSDRSVAFPGFSDQLSATYDAHSTQLFAEAAYGVDVGPGRLEPFAGIAYVHLDTDSFTETGGAAALMSPGWTQDTTFTTLGLNAAADLNLAYLPVRLSGTVGWRHAFGDVDPGAPLAFASGGQSYQITGQPIAEDALVLDAGLELQVAPGALLALSYAGQIADGASDQGLKGSFSYAF
ncbi:autotransporter domain-containing protein [Amorphus sp. 3PC139-8]|uniref:autotransporter domain-containing protein n=1 Tax=Amorphus sp. 3PC139-8 TaxID=2735676 RepID=UPI00345D9E18